MEKIYQNFIIMYLLYFSAFLGLGSSAGLGNFNKKNGPEPFSPWGAYAGLNLGPSEQSFC